MDLASSDSDLSLEGVGGGGGARSRPSDGKREEADSGIINSNGIPPVPMERVMRLVGCDEATGCVGSVQPSAEQWEFVRWVVTRWSCKDEDIARSGRCFDAALPRIIDGEFGMEAGFGLFDTMGVGKTVSMLLALLAYDALVRERENKQQQQPPPATRARRPHLIAGTLSILEQVATEARRLAPDRRVQVLRAGSPKDRKTGARVVDRTAWLVVTGHSTVLADYQRCLVREEIEYDLRPFRDEASWGWSGLTEASALKMLLLHPGGRLRLLLCDGVGEKKKRSPGGKKRTRRSSEDDDDHDDESDSGGDGGDDTDRKRNRIGGGGGSKKRAKMEGGGGRAAPSDDASAERGQGERPSLAHVERAFQLRVQDVANDKLSQDNIPKLCKVLEPPGRCASMVFLCACCFRAGSHVPALPNGRRARSRSSAERRGPCPDVPARSLAAVFHGFLRLDC